MRLGWVVGRQMAFTAFSRLGRTQARPRWGMDQLHHWRAGVRPAFRVIADNGEFEVLSLESLYDAKDPEYKETQTHQAK